jgi:hypothetical protein
MTSSLRVIPLSTITEVGCRQRLARTSTGLTRVDAIDVYLLMSTIDEAPPPLSAMDEDHNGVRHDALRFSKSLDDGGPGQIRRLGDFARLIASLVGRPNR